MEQVRQRGAALGAGILFGLGLGLSQMIDRGRVLGFLDLAGDWDPALLFVLGGAVGVTVLTFRFILRQPRPLWADRFQLPTKTDLDLRLILGAAIFGIGWGVGGYCPGPAIAVLAFGGWNPVIFLMAFWVGSLVARQIDQGLNSHQSTPLVASVQNPPEGSGALSQAKELS